MGSGSDAWRQRRKGATWAPTRAVWPRPGPKERIYGATMSLMLTQVPWGPHTSGAQHCVLLAHDPQLPLLQAWPPQSLQVVQLCGAGQEGVDDWVRIASS